MKISRIETQQQFFRGNETTNPHKKREFIDVITDKVRNPRDINDCVAVPRGIFKAYISLMAGTALVAMANTLPKKAAGVKTAISVTGWGLNILSAYYFAKPFAFKGNLPTVTKENLQKKNEITEQNQVKNNAAN